MSEKSPAIEPEIAKKLKPLSEFSLPKELEPYRLAVVHEIGHITTALSLGKAVNGYFLHLGHKTLSWWEDTKNKPQIDHGDLGGTLWKSQGLRKNDPIARKIAAGGIAAEIACFGHVSSDRQMQLSDRQSGAFKDFTDFFNVGDEVADQLDSSNLQLFYEVADLVCHNRGLEKLNHRYTERKVTESPIRPRIIASPSLEPSKF